MYDCVFPTRTAVRLMLWRNPDLLDSFSHLSLEFPQRFGNALTSTGTLSLKQSRYATDFRPIEVGCNCLTCRCYTRAYVHIVATRETVGCHLLTLHNLTYQFRLMRRIHEAIIEDRFPAFVQDFFKTRYGEREKYPKWAVNALRSVHIEL
jgi:queuine tRNA-ribosyltransferase